MIKLSENKNEMKKYIFEMLKYYRIFSLRKFFYDRKNLRRNKFIK